MYQEQIEWRHGSINVTDAFVRLMKDLIEIMTSRFPAAAFRACLRKADLLAEFLEYLNEWEHSTENSGFIFASTAKVIYVLCCAAHFFSYSMLPPSLTSVHHGVQTKPGYFGTAVQNLASDVWHKRPSNTCAVFTVK